MKFTPEAIISLKLLTTFKSINNKNVDTTPPKKIIDKIILKFLLLKNYSVLSLRFFLSSEILLMVK